ncbi:MAG TPA: hypothetical protein VM734_01745 [Kofleriaceae bacterium]|jgi:hypothetical protein|nr:hypothetical protein [Kofleriaceae bacterium]
MRSCFIAVVVLLVGSMRGAGAAPADTDAWLDGLHARVAAELAAGQPLVVQVHVPLCSNQIIACGNPRLGDGDRPAGNLYWATTEGFLGWFGRRGGGWTQVLAADGRAVGEAEVLDVRVWRKELPTPAAWRKAGAPRRFTVYVVAQAWRGAAIDQALARYADDLHGAHTRTVTLADGTTIAAGGDAHVVAYVGHNRLMDLDGFDWAAAAKRGDQRVRGAIAIACHTAVYLQDTVPGPRQVPLVMTRDFLFASSASLEGAVLAFAAGGDYAAIRRGAAAGYAAPSKKELRRVFGAFTNPADRKWGRPGYHKGINAHAAQHRAAQGRSAE